MRRPYRLSVTGYPDVGLPARLDYPKFAAVVERARREVVRDNPAWSDIHVYAMSAEAKAGELAPWGEFYLPSGPIVIYQLPYEVMPDQENYYRQIKAVLVHEFQHAEGEMHGERVPAYVAAR